MALIFKTNKFGVEFNDAYHKISNLEYKSFDVMTKLEDEDGDVVDQWLKHNVVEFKLSTYSSAIQRAQNMDPICVESYSFNPDFNSEYDLIDQAYNYIKNKFSENNPVNA